MLTMWPQSPGISVSWEPFLCKRLLCKACQGLGALTFYFRENQRTSSRSLLGQMLTLRCRQHVFTKHRGEAITFLFILSEKQVHLSQYMPGTVVKETQRHSECRGPPEAQDSFAAPRLSPSVILHPPFLGRESWHHSKSGGNGKILSCHTGDFGHYVH